MWSKFEATIIGLIFTIIFFYTFSIAYMFFLPTLRYGDDEVIRRIANFDLLLLIVFIITTIVFFRIFIRRIKTAKSYGFSGFLIFFTLLLFISYPLMVYSPFIEIHTFGFEMLYFEALRLNFYGGYIFLIYGIALDIIKYRINKKT